jgi:hypothetical protein
VELESVDGWAVFNTLVTLIVAFVVIPLRSKIDKLTESDEKLRDEIRSESGLLHQRVGALEVDVAKNYAPRAEVVAALGEISGKLDRITVQLDGKIRELDHGKADK